jgi:hypothetical protein
MNIAGAKRIRVAEDPEEVFRLLYERGATDGLPIIPPTPERVDRMLSAASRPRTEVIATLPPRDTPATVEAVAINAVMAGCLPEYLPVVLAAVEAMSQPEFDLQAVSTTTSGPAILCLVNGPIRQPLKINSSYGVFGPGWRANATIGRALRLIALNVGGAIPVEVSQSTMGFPGRYTMCVAEFEERSPWQPFHVENGFAATDSTVTIIAATGMLNLYATNKTAEGLLVQLAHSMDATGLSDMQGGNGTPFLFLCPDHAGLLAGAGFSKAEVKRFLHERTRRTPLERFPGEDHARLRESGRVQDGGVSFALDASQFQIVVAGGLGGLHSAFVPTFNGVSKYVSRRVEKAPA